MPSKKSKNTATGPEQSSVASKHFARRRNVDDDYYDRDVDLRKNTQTYCGKVRVFCGNVRVYYGDVCVSCKIPCGEILSVAFFVCAKRSQGSNSETQRLHGYPRAVEMMLGRSDAMDTTQSDTKESVAARENDGRNTQAKPE